MDSLAPTGERTAPGLPREDYWLARHAVVYRWAVGQLPSSGAVIDAGAGEGYGAQMLLAPQRGVVALEYDEPTARHLRRSYPSVATVRANLAALPLRTDGLAAIVCLQVVEHLWSLPAFLSDCHRALRPGGCLIASTPNRPVFSPGLGRGERPVNPFHVEEFDADQVQALLAQASFGDIEMYGVHHGPRITAWESAHGSIVDAQVAAVLRDAWEDDLESFIASVTETDFEVRPDCVGAQDLVAIARKAAA